MNGVQTAYDRSKNAAKTVFDRVVKESGRESDPDLIIYQGLKPTDFEELGKSYGIENLLGYVKAMEFKRIKGRK